MAHTYEEYLLYARCSVSSVYPCADNADTSWNDSITVSGYVRCNVCGGTTSLIADNANAEQKRILKQSRVDQSLYLQTLASMNSNINTANVGNKHGSYQRRLNRLKGKVYGNQTSVTGTAVKGNKTQAYNISSFTPTCNCN